MVMQEMIKDLENQAREAGEKILADARSQAKIILKEAEAEGEILSEESLSAVKSKLEVEKAKIFSSANFFVKKEVIKAKEKLIGQLFNGLEKNVGQEFSSGSDRTVFQKLADESLSNFKEHKVKVMVNNKDRDLARSVLENSGLEYELADGLNAIGGLKVEADDGRIVIDNTIDSRLKKLRHIYEPEIIKTLFGEEK